MFDDTLEWSMIIGKYIEDVDWLNEEITFDGEDKKWNRDLNR